MNDPIIEMRDVRKRFGAKDAVSGLTFQAPRGQVTAFLGPNGAGKTTTIQMALNLLRRDGGEARVLEVDAKDLKPDHFQRIGYVSENQELPLWMKVDGYLDFLRPMYPKWDRSLEKTLRTRFDLPGATRLKDLSRGMRMKAQLLSSLAFRPELVVLDEPFSGLDPLARDEFLDGLLEMTGENGWSVFVSSHDIDEVQRLTDHVVIIDQGRAALEESVDSLQRRFRRVECVFSEETTSKGFQPKPDWLEYSQSGRVLRWVDPTWQEGTTREAVAAFNDASVDLRSEPMNLREIFVALAKTYRLTATQRQPITTKA